MATSQTNEHESMIEELFVKEQNSTITAKSISTDSDSEEEALEKWYSLLIPVHSAPKSDKSELFSKGLYDPGSGEVCAKYIPISDSSILRHPYYNYPSIKDPGIVYALLEPEPFKRSADNQEFYLHICKELKTVPVKIFLRNLSENIINLQYYGVTSKGVQAMCLTLRYNYNVKRLDLSGNYLDQDACFHLGQLIGENEILQEIILSQCKLQKEGFRRVVVNVWRRNSLDVLNVAGNGIGDDGFQLLIDQFEKGATIKKLYVSRNELTAISAVELSQILNTRTNICTHLDMSWNSLGTVQIQANKLLRALALSTVLVVLNLSYNYLASVRVLEPLMRAPKLLYLDLRNNQLGTTSVRFIEKGIQSTKNLKTLKLSRNPFTPEDALRILKALSSKPTTVVSLQLNNIDVQREFIEELQALKAERPQTKVTHGRVVNDYAISELSMAEIVLRRLEFLTASRKKSKFDFNQYLLTLKQSGKDFVNVKMIMRELKDKRVKNVKEDILIELSNAFPGNIKNENIVNINAACDYLKRMYSDKEPRPITPPPSNNVKNEIKEKVKKSKKSIKLKQIIKKTK